MKCTIEHELAGEYTDDEIAQVALNFKSSCGFILDSIRSLPIFASYDMEWNKRNTGWVYESLSGHKFLIGCRIGNVISFGVRAKKCAMCGRANILCVSPPSRVCIINIADSSGSMEAKLALELTT